MPEEEARKFPQHLIEKYGIAVSEDVIASIYTSKPKLRKLFSRASFRPEAIRTEERARRERRSFLRNALGLVAISVPLLVWIKVALFSPQAQAPTYVTNPEVQASGGRLLVNARSVPVDQSLTLEDPSLGPFLLIHLDNGQLVAYSSICTHAGCQVQFDPYSRHIACPCHGAVFDPYNNARVLGGPAPYPLQTIPIGYDKTTGNIYLQ